MHRQGPAGHRFVDLRHEDHDVAFAYAALRQVQHHAASERRVHAEVHNFIFREFFLDERTVRAESGAAASDQDDLGAPDGSQTPVFIFEFSHISGVVFGRDPDCTDTHKEQLQQQCQT